MKIYVCSKQLVPNSQTKSDRSGVEEAIRLKKRNGAEVIFLCLGSKEAMTQIREAMSLGCDGGVLLSVDEPDKLDAAACASVFAAYLDEQRYDAIVTSCYAIDSDAIQLGLILAGKLRLPFASYAEEIKPGPEGTETLWVKRKFEDCVYSLSIPMPCLVSALPKPNQPLYMTPMEISRAYRTEIPEISAEELLARKGLPSALKLARVRVLESAVHKPRNRGNILTVSTKEAVDAIMDTMMKHHILG